MWYVSLLQLCAQIRTLRTKCLIGTENCAKVLDRKQKENIHLSNISQPRHWSCHAMEQRHESFSHGLHLILENISFTYNKVNIFWGTKNDKDRNVIKALLNDDVWKLLHSAVVMCLLAYAVTRAFLMTSCAKAGAIYSCWTHNLLLLLTLSQVLACMCNVWTGSAFVSMVKSSSYSQTGPVQAENYWRRVQNHHWGTLSDLGKIIYIKKDKQNTFPFADLSGIMKMMNSNDVCVLQLHERFELVMILYLTQSVSASGLTVWSSAWTKSPRICVFKQN